MAEGRMLKKRITLSKKMAALKTDKARLLWFYMLPFTDVKGRINADPEDIRDEILRKQRKGYTAARIQQYLLDLDVVGLIILYSDGNGQYLQFTRFTDEQNLNPKREAKSQIPAPLTEDSRGLQSNRVKLSKVKLSKDNNSSSRCTGNVTTNRRETKKHSTTTAERIVSAWQKLPLPQEKKAIRAADLLAIERLVSELSADTQEPVHEGMILEAIENYGQALKLPNSQTFKHKLHPWLKKHVRKYVSYAFDIDHHDGSKFNDGTQTESVADQVKRMEEQGEL